MSTTTKVLIAVAVIVIGYFAYKYFFKKDTTPAPTPTK